MARHEKKYSLKEIYLNILNAIRTISYLKKAAKKGLIKKDFRQRIMLAVTEVNGCALCSYEHAKIALKAGMSEEEIEALKNGELQGVPEEEMKAILFAKHYADQRAKPDMNAWEEIINEYKEEKAFGILGAIRMIMAGNSVMMPLHSLFDRLTFKKTDERSNMFYELSVLICLFPMIFLALLHTLLLKIFQAKIIN